MNDHTSAAAFCTSNGAVIPPRAAAQIAERTGLAAWAPPPTADALTTDSSETRRLLHLLLTIYTVDTTYASQLPLPVLSYKFSRPTLFFFHVSPPATSPDVLPPPHLLSSVAPSPPPPSPAPQKAPEVAAAHLLASHAASFDPQTVLSTVPPHWPLRTLSLYLVRTLRTAAHTSHERTLVKGLATGQNLAVTDVAHEQLRAAGALVEEALNEDEGGMTLGTSGEDEVLDEKAALTVDPPASMAVDVPLRGKGEWAGEEEVSADVLGAVGSWMTSRSSVTDTSAGGNDTG